MEKTKRIGRLLERLQDDLDDSTPAAALAHEVHYSHFHALRCFQQATGETPAAFRRRLRLERAAHRLGRSEDAITEIALDAGFGSLEGFTRAFRRAFGVSPSLYRRAGTPSYYLPAPNGIHFQGDPPSGEHHMDLLDLLLEHDLWLMRQVLERAAALSDSALDRTQSHEDESLRQRLDRHIFEKEVWVAAIRGETMPDARDLSVAGMRERLETSAAAFSSLAREVRDGARWQAVFVDALCVPPETFSFVGMVAHVLTQSVAGRRPILQALSMHGVHGLSDDPIPFDRLHQAAQGVGA